MGGKRILSDAQVEEMIDLRERGWAVARIADRFTAAGTPISVGSISWQCLRVGADAPLTKRRTAPPTETPYKRNGRIVRPFEAADDAVLREMDHRGERISAMARRLGRMPNSVRGRLLTMARHEARS